MNTSICDHVSHGNLKNLPGAIAGRLSGLFLLAALTAQPVLAGLPPIKTVFIILMENTNWAWLTSTSAPYLINTLTPMGAHANQYYNPPSLHPSTPNYLWLEMGSAPSWAIGWPTPSPTTSITTPNHLIAYLTSMGISWKSYAEDIDGTHCPLTNMNLYTPIINPFVYFTDITNNNDPNSSYCIQHIRPYTELATDLSNNNVARYNFITPNLCNDMHNCTIQTGDTWLSQAVPKILQSAAYKNGGALFITFDEGSPDGPIPMIVVSPYAKPNYSNSIYYTHSSTLRTFQEIFGVTSAWLGDAIDATDLSDLFVNAGAVDAPPVVATPASAMPNPVTGTTNLSVLGSDPDDAESTLTYRWAAPGLPPGPVTFSVNGSNAAKNTTATFTNAGVYNIQATIRDPAGGAVISSVIVTVNQTPTGITVTPSTASVFLGNTQVFRAQEVDQFGNAMSSQPAITWTISGGGTIDSTGLFTAGVAGGPFTVTATAGTIKGTSTVNVVPFSTLLLLHSDSSEVSGVTNGSVVTPAVAPTGFTGTVAVNGSGSVNFVPAKVGNGVYFQNCCWNVNNAYYTFKGAKLGTIFNVTQGQISFYLKSRYSFAQRKASAPDPRYAFDVQDASTDWFYFYTHTSSGYLVFYYMVNGTLRYYIPAPGTEDIIFGNGVILKVTIKWGAGTSSLYFNDVLVASASYPSPSPSWTAASTFDIGAYNYFGSGYNVSDDVIDEFTVMNQ